MGMIGNFLGFRNSGGRIERELEDQLGGRNSIALLHQQRQQNAAMAQSLSHAAAGGQAPGAALRQSSQFLEGANARAQQSAMVARLREQQQATNALNSFRSQRRGDNQAAFGRMLGMGATLGSFLADDSNGTGHGGHTGSTAARMAAAGSMFSDRRTKHSVKKTPDAKMREFLRASKAKDWAYRDEFGGQSRTGPMAQDLERSEIGRKMVSRDRESGMRTIDQGGAISALLAAAGSLNDRLERVESKGGDDA